MAPAIFTSVKETSKVLGCSEGIVYSLRTQQGALKSPPKKKPKREDYQKNTRALVYGMQIQTLIRRKVYWFFLSNISSTLNCTLTSVSLLNDIPNFKRTTRYKLSLDNSFVFGELGKKRIMNERDEIIRWRHSYLKDKKK